MELHIITRQETEKDHEAVRELVRLAFLNVPFGDHDEHFLVDRLRRSETFIPELSIVAEIAGEIVGYILFTKLIIENGDERTETLSLAPLAVLPEYQCRGIGSALVTEGLTLAKAMAYQSVIVVGHPHYYPRFGFMPAGEWGICAPFDVPGEAFMACELCEGALRGVKGTVLFPKEFGL
ncbi:MAG: GNAT family N-acetyltransferase [Bacillota bacterium]